MTVGVRTAVAAAPPPERPLTAADLTIGDPVWVAVYGRWRRGEVVQLAQVRVRVRYPVDPHGDTRTRWMSTTPDEPVYHGGLSDPVTYRCGGRCRLTVTGRPGQSVAQVRAAHERTQAHHRDLS